MKWREQEKKNVQAKRIKITWVILYINFLIRIFFYAVLFDNTNIQLMYIILNGKTAQNHFGFNENVFAWIKTVRMITMAKRKTSNKEERAKR